MATTVMSLMLVCFSSVTLPSFNNQQDLFSLKVTHGKLVNSRVAFILGAHKIKCKPSSLSMENKGTEY